MDENTLKITVNSIEKYKSENQYTKDLSESVDKVAGLIEHLKILQMIWSRQLSPDQYNGIINLLYVTFYPNATTKETETALVNINISEECAEYNFH